jgi:phosphoribosylanthranilate isomerase
MYMKICCISSIEEAILAISYGASAIGLVSEMPSGPGVIEDEQIFKISKFAMGKAETFLLTSKLSSSEIIYQLSKCKITTVQIVDQLVDGTYQDIRDAIENIRIIQVVHISDESSVEHAILVSRSGVDGILLDSGNPVSKIKELGGTGRTHNWILSQEIVEKVKVPVYLAGGLNSDNVCDAIQIVRPYGVDVCSGVRTNYKLDEDKLKSFVRKVSQCQY